jgi:hypothetical protein
LGRLLLVMGCASSQLSMRWRLAYVAAFLVALACAEFS